MPRSIYPAINDILETIDRVRSKVAGKTLTEFRGDWELRFIVERAIEIIPEATRRVPDDLKALRPEIPGEASLALATFCGTSTTQSPTR